ncbi:MAG TPA: CDP-diacylglycerol--glycerol-3-phosphate 3-phosphatidyltransferase [Candidatus Dormibacteraeota bacterium]|nr:CDP-diacylglycerol--glycerol-3-phosphate 3-phosphatidyltransferase [Candidatus Dormibacteraeota bacterium]
MNIPNALTISRLVAIPLLMALLLLRFPGHDQVAAALFIVFSLTDTLDGQLARRRGKVTDLGKFLDPLADKLFVLSVLIVLVQESLVAAWVVVLIFSRELIITILRSVGASQGRVIAAAPLGKTKTVTQMAAVALLILQRPYPAVIPFAGAVVAIAVVFTLWSGLDYLWRFRYLLLPLDTSRMRVSPSGGAPEPSLAADLGSALRGTGLTVSVAESCTGGMVGAAITDEPGSSEYFAGGAIAYSNELKESELSVPRSLLDSVGAVSREVAEAMAQGARKRYGTSLAVAVTGIAGPDSDGSSKPVGLTYIAVASESGTSSSEFRFTGDRLSNRRQATEQALRMLIAAVHSVGARPGVKSA